MKRSEIAFSALLVPLDFAALLIAFYISYYIRYSFTLISPDDFGPLASKLQYSPGGYLLSASKYWHYIGYIIPIMIVIFALSGLYAIRSTLPWYRRFTQILIGVSVGEFAILFLFLLKKDFFLPRSAIFYSWILATVIVFLFRYAVYLLQKLLHKYNIGIIRIGLVGKNDKADRLIRELGKLSYADYRLVYHSDQGNVETVAQNIRKDKMDRLMVVSEQFTGEELITLRNICLENHIEYCFVPTLFTELPSSYEVSILGGLPVVEVRPTPLEGWGRLVKRLFDVIVSLILIILFSPIFLFVAIWLKLTNPGPLFYKHRRVGYQKNPIDVWKFRTMKYEWCTGPGYKGDAAFQQLINANPELKKEWESTFKLTNDPRVPLSGKILRKTNLDELPQFFNVLLGSLSLVGPRPIVEGEIKKYGEKARILFTVKPGVTGLWQVSGRNDVTYEERTSMDAQYIEQWNLWRDIKIILLTAYQMLKRDKKGAY